MQALSTGVTALKASAALAATAAAILTAVPVSAASFSQLVTFGDSLVDTGNTFNQTGIPSAPYFEGRFSNGPLWNDYLANELDIPLNNFGFAGATSTEIGAILFNGQLVDFVPGLQLQVDAYISGSIDPDALYGIWVGANDYLFAGVSNPSFTVNNITTAVSELGTAGAENFLLLNLPDLGALPVVDILGLSAAEEAELNALSTSHNQLLATAVETLNASGEVNVSLLDINALFDQVVTAGAPLSNTTDACILVATCVTNPDVQSSFLFWDEVHPTTATHAIVADAALAKISPVAVPEPTALLGLSILGIWGITRRRR